MIHLKGRVVIRESSYTVRSDELWLDTDHRVGRSEGFLLVDDGVTAVHGESGEFDFTNHAGVVRATKGGHGDWRIRAKSVRLAPSRKLDYRGAWFTGCNVEPRPHYHFRAARLTAVPKKYLLARHAVFFLGKVPIFYTPILYKSLKKRHFVRWKLEPGYDRRNGPFVKGTLTNEHGPHAYSKLYLDYYSRQGVGAGGELQRKKGDDRGVLFGYRIRETHNSRERWAVVANQYQGLVSSVAFQGRVQVQSDPDFNNHYARASLFRVTPELINSAALVYRLPSVTARIGYSRTDTATLNRATFEKSQESAPRLEFQTTSLKLWRLPWLNTFSGAAESNFKKGRPFLEQSVGSSWEGTNTVNLARGLSLTPKLGYGQTHLNRVDAAADALSTSTVRDVFIGRYFVEGTLRWANRAGDWDLSQRFQRRQKHDSLQDDAGAPDHGVETNLLALRHALRPHRRLLLRSESGYDFRVFRDRSVGFRERIQPLVGEVIYSPSSRLDLILRDEYRLEGGNSAMIAHARYGEEEGRFVGGGASYNRAFPDQYFGDVNFQWTNATGTWKLGGALRGLASSPGGVERAHGLRVFEKEVLVARRWHDFYTRALVRFRPGGVKEFFIRLDLILPSFVKERLPRRDWESEWFPERRSEFIERP